MIRFKIISILLILSFILIGCSDNTIEDTLVVEDTIVVEDTLVDEDTIVEEDAFVVEDTLVDDNTFVEEDTLVDDNTFVEEDALVEEDTLVVEDAFVDEDTLLVEDTPIITENTQINTTTEPIVSNILDDIWTAFNKIISTSRTRGTDGEIIARDYLKAQLELVNFDVEIQPFEFYDMDLISQSNDFFNINPYNSNSLGTAYNIIAQKDFDPSKKTVIFSAHYDSTRDSIGAFDNGSGTAILLESAKLISNMTASLDYNIRIIFFSCEEYFLTGSKYYVNGLTQEEKNNILGCFNIDMVGNSIARTELYYGNQGEISPIIDELLRISPQFQYTNLGSSDDYSFYRAGINSFTMTTSNHRHSDFDPQTLDLELDNKYVETEFLIKDANTVFNFMKNFNINNWL